MWVASSVCTKKAICEPSGDHWAPETRAPRGTSMSFTDPSAAEMTRRPAMLRIESERWRFACGSRNCPPSSSNGREKRSIVTGPSLTS